MPLLPDELDDESLVRYLRGECSPDESAAVERWADGSADRGKRLELLRRGWAVAGEPVLRGDVDKGWMAIAAQLDLSADSDTKSKPATRVLRVIPVERARPRWIPARYAAGIALLMGTAGVFAWKVARHGLVSSTSEAGAMREIATGMGQRADVYLSDGTHVVLGAVSRLSFPATFGASRNVKLLGQAYFDVVHDETRPFAVHTARVVARDVGTKFDVRAYADSENVVVTVTEGAVMLRSAPAMQKQADSVLLKRSEVGVVSPDGRLAVTDNIDVDAQVAWTHGKLVFQRTPARDAIAQVNRWYGADLRIGDSTVAGLALTMSITNEPLPETIRFLAHALDARTEERGSTVVLYARAPR